MSAIMADVAVLMQVKRLRAAGKGLSNQSVKIDSGSSLSTCKEYRACIEEINRAMELFKNVAVADAQQVAQFYRDMEAQDNA